MHLRIQHTTRYRYDAPLLGECFMEARLRPLSVPGEQDCRRFQLTTDPAASVFAYSLPDQMGTVSHFIVRQDSHRELTISAESTVETQRENPFQGVTLDAGDRTMLADPALAQQQAEWLAPTPLVPLDTLWAGPDVEDSVFEWAQALGRAIHEEFEYLPGATDVSTPLTEFVAQRRGVCQDFAHLMLAAGRANGVPARYVSGYIFPGDVPDTHGAGATHAWVEFYLPHAGLWRGFDPTNNLVVADRHVKIAVGRDYADVPPTKGLLRAAPGQRLPITEALEVEVRIEQGGPG